MMTIRRAAMARRWTGLNRLGVAAALLAAGACASGCNDVGDNTGGNPMGDDSGLDGTTPTSDGGGGGPSHEGGDATTPPGDATPETTTGDSPADEGVDQGTPEDAGADTAPGADAHEDGTADAVADAPGEALADASSDADATTQGPDAGPEAGPDAQPDQGVADAPIEAAPEAGTTTRPCVGSGDAPGCVQCDHSANGICTQTEALIVQLDIDKGLYSGTVPNAYPGSSPSCYECLVSRHGLDSMISHNHECDDLTGNVPGSSSLTNMQGCLAVLSCVLGDPVNGSSPWASCANDAVDGYANCYCGANEPDTTSCSTAQPISAHSTGGLGISSPNGACAEVMLAGVGDSDITSPGQVLTDIGVTTVGTGRALSMMGVAGTQIASPSCGQCFQ
jgi:hypothetical protein